MQGKTSPFPDSSGQGGGWGYSTITEPTDYILGSVGLTREQWNEIVTEHPDAYIQRVESRYYLVTPEHKGPEILNPTMADVEFLELVLGSIASIKVISLLRRLFGKKTKKIEKQDGPEIIEGSEKIHTDHTHGQYTNGHRHWLEKHVNPKDPTKFRIVRRTGPLQ